MTRMITITDNWDGEPVSVWPQQVESVGIDQNGRACLRIRVLTDAPMGMGKIKTEKTVTTTQTDVARLFETLQEAGLSEEEFFHYVPKDVPDDEDADYFTELWARFDWEDPPIVFAHEGATALKVSTGANRVDEPYQQFVRRLEEFMARKLPQ